MILRDAGRRAGFLGTASATPAPGPDAGPRRAHRAPDRADDGSRATAPRPVNGRMLSDAQAARARVTRSASRVRGQVAQVSWGRTV
ncbi:hypothetical protein GCM10010512_15890 [Streptomyces thermoviolaceus subsp. thermoviolaceus]|nr:hypothetical protein GCM10010499_23430 [Streptomyces thermoviolaceus subsp. apingens]GHA85089.1 hypothetical protein GCM10010512_15890 [Streptomyces thermoviolaceus subsp. thermoviolaceus]